MSVSDTMETKRYGHSTARAISVSAEAELSIPVRYQVQSEIGQGGMGIVYKVRDTDMMEIVALKVLKPEIAADETMRETLRKEVALARKVTHRNVCRIYEFHRSNASACVSMEFVDGESLLAKLRRAGPLPVAESISIAREVCAGLGEAHSQGIVHRDLKPANIMLGTNGSVKVMDFGIARLSQDTGQHTRTFVGTPNYMSPEQVELKSTGPRSDIYSLGLVLYEMVTGVAAFQGESPILVALDQLRRVPKRPAQIVPSVPSALEQVILKCLEKQPSKRYSSVDELDAALQACVQPRDPAIVAVGKHVSSMLTQGAKSSRAAGEQISAFAREFKLPKVNAPVLARAILSKSRQLFICDELLSASPMRLAQVGAILGIVFMATAITFGLVTQKPSSHRVVSQPTGYAARQKQTLLAISKGAVTPVSTAYQPTKEDVGVLSGEVDLSKAMGIPTDAAASSDESEPTPTSESDSLPNSHPTAAARPVSVKRVKLRIQPSVTLPIPASETAEILQPLEKVKPAPVDVSNSAKKPAILSPASGSASKTDQTASSQQPSVPETYLEVGSFKDAEWADSAVDRLSHLGFKALSVHKGHLWAQSYHVEVGPYSSIQDLEKAESDLNAQGFKPHAVQ